MLKTTLLFSILFVTPALSNFYGSMSGYACNQPGLYQSCNCHSFCQTYMNHEMHYPSCGGQCGGYGQQENTCEDEYGCEKKRRKHKKKKNKKKKFRFSEEEEQETPPKKGAASSHDDDEFPLPPNSEEVSETSRKTGKTGEKEWEDDDKWESKFVSKLTTTAAPVRTSGGAGGGLAGLGLGNGGLFGISSGVGVGVPGVGPIGVSSGLGIG